MITAEIVPEYKDSMWMKIDRPDGTGSMWAIYENEIEPIMKACKEYLEKGCE